MRTILFLFFAAMGLTGCTSTRTIELVSDPDFSEVNNEAKKRTATVSFVNGAVARVDALSVSNDLTSGQVKGGSFQTWPTNSITKIRFHNSGEGAGQGIRIGFLAGAGVGLAAYLADPPSCNSGGFGGCIDPGPVAVGLAVGVIGALTGILIGAATQAKSDFFLTQPSSGVLQTSSSLNTNEVRNNEGLSPGLVESMIETLN